MGADDHLFGEGGGSSPESCTDDHAAADEAIASLATEGDASRESSKEAEEKDKAEDGEAEAKAQPQEAAEEKEVAAAP